MNMSIYFGCTERVWCHLTEDGCTSFVLLECFDLVFITIFIYIFFFFKTYNLTHCLQHKKEKEWIH